MIRWKLRFLFLSALAIGTGCGSNQNSGNSSTVPSIDLEHINDKTQIDPPNDEGYSKISIRYGDQYKEGVLDAQQKEVIVPSTELFVQDITGSRALIQLERKFLFVPLEHGPYSDKDFAEVAGFQSATPYRCGVAMVVVNDRWFYIQEDGTRVSAESFDWAEPFHHDRALVKSGEHYQIIKPDGSLVKVLEHEQAAVQSPWCWQVINKVDGKFWSGFVDLDGNLLTELHYENVGYYDEEVKRTRVGRNGRFGFVNEHAKEVIPAQYEYAEIFDRGKARVVLNGRTFFIDPDGNEVPD